MQDLSYVKPALSHEHFFLKPRDDVNERLKMISKRFSFSVDERSDDAVQVFLRVKPNEESSNSGFLSFVEEEDNTLLLKMNSTISKYSFTHIFKPDTTQEQIFLKSTVACLQEFFKGRSAFIFTYGTSSSGKTFTIHGKKNYPGLSPRIIASMFATVENYVDDLFCYCPERSITVVKLSEREMQDMCTTKEKAIWRARFLLQQYSKSDDMISLDEMEELKNKAIKFEILERENSVFSIWVSFAEIYNEKIYDLLDEPKEVRTPLSISTDKDKQPFIKGLRYIHVTTMEEAYLLYLNGCYNRTVRNTSVNEKSSRSHSIFTIKVLGRRKQSGDNLFIMSSISVCDLAGTERSIKTKNYGSGLKESNNINTSFLVLNRCLKIIRENQLREVRQVVPYRESKLTQIMGPSFCNGDINLLMIVTVTQCPNLMNETQASLKSSAIATEIKAMVINPVKEKKKMRFSTTISHLNPGRGVNWRTLASDNKQTSSMLSVENRSLAWLKELEEEKSKRLEAETKLAELEKELKGKSSIVDKQRKLIDQNLYSEKSKVEAYELQQQELINLRKEMNETYEKFMSSRIDCLKVKKKNRLLQEEFDLLKAEVQTLKADNEKLEDMLDDAKEEVEILQEELTKLHEEIVEKDNNLVLKDEKISSLALEISFLEENLHDNACEREGYEKFLMSLESELNQKKAEINKVKEEFSNKCREYEEQIKLLHKQLETETLRELRHRKEQKSSNFKIVVDYASDEDNSVLRTPEVRCKSEECLYLNDDSDPSFVLSSSKSKTTAKKKKRGQAKKLEGSYYFDDKNLSSANTGVTTRRKLYVKTEEELGESTRFSEEDNTQASPNTIMRTLRTGKRY